MTTQIGKPISFDDFISKVLVPSLSDDDFNRVIDTPIERTPPAPKPTGHHRYKQMDVQAPCRPDTYVQDEAPLMQRIDLSGFLS